MLSKPRTAAGIVPPKAILQIIRHRFPAKCFAAGWFSLEGYHVHDSFLLQALGFLCFFFGNETNPFPRLEWKEISLSIPSYLLDFDNYSKGKMSQVGAWFCEFKPSQVVILTAKHNRFSGDRSHTAGVAGSVLVPTGSVYHHVEEAVFRGRRPRLCKDLVSIRDFGRGMCTNNKWAINSW